MDIRSEVDYQVEEYGIDISEAIENVSDSEGWTFSDVLDAYYSRSIL